MKVRYRKNRTLRTLFGWLLICVMALTVSAPVLAADAKAVSAVADQSGIYVYVKGIPEIQADSRIQIGNTLCPTESIAVSPVSGLSVPMRTFILLDNSKSIPSQNHAGIQEIMLGMVENALENEQIKIAAISDQMNELCDFTSDKEALRGVIDGITYNDQDTYLSDILYQVILELKKDMSAYTRILVISDGADDQAIGYTNDEVLGLIKESPYQIYTIGMSGKNNAAELETMFSFSRASGSEYFLLDENTSNEEILSALLADQGNICIRIVPEESMKDGSNKKILLQLSTSDGVKELVTSVDMPFGAGAAEEEEPEEEQEEEPEPEPVEEPKEELPTLSPNTSVPADVQEDTKDSVPWALFAIPVVLIAALGIGIVFLRKKRQVPPENRESAAPDPAPAEIELEEEADETVFAGNRAAGDQAIGLWSAKEKNYIVLTNVEMPNAVYRVEILNEIRIGRLGTDIEIKNDSLLSRSHCCILLRGELLYIKDMESKNGTFYEHMRVYEETPIISGGKIQIGKYTYRVELVKE